MSDYSPAPSFATVADIELVIQQPIVGPDKIQAANFGLFSVSAAIRNYCRQTLYLVENDQVILDSGGGRVILLPQLPVVSVSVVSENGLELVTSSHYLLGQFGSLGRIGRPWFRGPGAVAVTYTHGYAVIPDDIRSVTARAASRLYQAGLRAADSAGGPGVVSKSLGDFAVTYGAEAAAEGTMGASGARVLLLSEKDLLDAYRV